MGRSCNKTLMGYGVHSKGSDFISHQHSLILVYCFGTSTQSLVQAVRHTEADMHTGTELAFRTRPVGVPWE